MIYVVNTLKKINQIEKDFIEIKGVKKKYQNNFLAEDRK